MIDGSRDFTAAEAVHTSAFWLLSSGHALALLIVSAVMLHLVPHLTRGLHYSLTEAGGIVALMTAFQLTGQIVGGLLGDRFEKRWICTICMFAHAGGLLLITYSTSMLTVSQRLELPEQRVTLFSKRPASLGGRM